MRIALFEPEIAGNVGAVLRLGACLGVAVDLIEPIASVPIEVAAVSSTSWEGALPDRRSRRGRRGVARPARARRRG